VKKRTVQNRVNSLSRLLTYILGHRPDEFGLVPDAEGFVSHKELLKALREEPGWGHVTRAHLNEVLIGEDRLLFEGEENRIRSVERRWRIENDGGAPDLSPDLPKILFAAVRRKAHPVVLEKGLAPSGDRFLVLSPDEETALRIGMRRDQRPVLLKVAAASAQGEGIPFHPFGDLFLSPSPIPPRHIQAPPLPKDLQEDREGGEGRKETPTRPVDFSPGTFVLDASRDPDPGRRAKGKKPRGWKEEARKVRKGKGAIR
jgi:putative RNA 2'-phosphotransferase